MSEEEVSRGERHIERACFQQRPKGGADRRVAKQTRICMLRRDPSYLQCNVQEISSIIIRSLAQIRSLADLRVRREFCPEEEGGLSCIRPFDRPAAARAPSQHKIENTPQRGRRRRWRRPRSSRVFRWRNQTTGTIWREFRTWCIPLRRLTNQPNHKFPQYDATADGWWSWPATSPMWSPTVPRGRWGCGTPTSSMPSADLQHLQGCQQ